MTATFARRIINTVAVSLTVASLALAVPANAGGISLSVGFGGGDAGMTMAHGTTLGMMTGKSPREMEWDVLDHEDRTVHLHIDGGMSQGQKYAHDCRRVKKIELILDDLYESLAKAQFVVAEAIEQGRTKHAQDDKWIVKSREDDIRHWKRELAEAKADCLI